MLYVNVAQVRPNPWQTRERPDEAWIAELAADIQGRRATRSTTKGLLQVPAGRLVDGAGAPAGYREEGQAQVDFTEGRLFLQLAYGHQRLAAFRRLAEDDDFYAHLPVDLVAFSDEEMATAAWAENWARQDLTPLEQARAIALMMEEFGWTQQQVAERLGLSQPTVANKLRLLRLPVEMRTTLQDGQMTERQALAVLPVAELSAEAVEALPAWQRREVQTLLSSAGTADSEALRTAAGELVERATRDLAEAGFPLDWAFEADAPARGARGVRAATCDGCERRLRGKRCGDPGCYELRVDEWRRRRLAEIAAELGGGIRVLDPAERRGLDYSARRTFYERDGGTVAFARAHGCEHLHLAWREVDYFLAADEAHPEATWVCVHGHRKRCTCWSGLDAETAARQKEQQRADARARREVLDGVAGRLARALDAGETGALRALLMDRASYSAREKMAKKTERADVVAALAKQVVQNAADWEGMTPAGAATRAAEWARGFGLDGTGAEPSGEADLADIRRRWARIQGWMDAEERTDEALRGNLANLERLMAELGELQIDQDLDALAMEIAAAHATLEGMVADERGL